MLWYSSDAGRFPGQLSNYQVGASGPYVRVNLEAYGETTDDPAAHVARQALDELQDYVDEASHEPWPGTRAPPRPFAEIRGPFLHLWYGGPDITSPVLLGSPRDQLRRIGWPSG